MKYCTTVYDITMQYKYGFIAHAEILDVIIALRCSTALGGLFVVEGNVINCTAYDIRHILLFGICC